jgi:hypothetical protein
MPLLEVMMPAGEEDISSYHSYLKEIMEPNQAEWDESSEPF